MKTRTSFEDRKFQFWHYTVSHGQLLIRSHKDSDNPKNIDIMFDDVIYLELPRYLSNLEIEKATNDDLLYVQDKIEKPVKIEHITILSSNDRRYLVAGRVTVVENELEMFEYPYFVPHG